jgi:hypothetical protein
LTHDSPPHPEIPDDIGEFPQPSNIDGKVVNLEVLLRPLTEIGDELGS